VKSLKLGFFNRLRGRCATAEPGDSGCWSYSDGQVRIDMARAPELSAPYGAVRLEGRGLPNRVLVVHCDDDRYRAVSNACTHGGRRLDPVPGTQTVQCCSLGRSTFDYDGRVLHGPAKGPVTWFAAKWEGDKLVIPVA
jgi:nitrite reductase/ring-hydroxylating ferredoxin subunit